MSPRRTVRAVHTIVLLLLLAHRGETYTCTPTPCSNAAVRWWNGQVTFFYSNSQFPFGTPAASALFTAATAWNGDHPNTAPGESLRYTLASTTAPQSSDNGFSEVYLDNDYYSKFPANSLAVTIFYSARCEPFLGHCVDVFNEQDIVAPVRPAGRTWNMGLRPDPFGVDDSFHYGYYFVLVMMHEFGHALGLGHEDRVLATMNSYYPMNGPTSTELFSEPDTEDLLGERFLYFLHPFCSGELCDIQRQLNQVDFAASARKYDTVPGNSAALPAPTSAVRGQTIDLVFRVLDRGNASPGGIPAAYYLSRDATIGNADDIQLTTTTFSSGPGSHGYPIQPVVIPPSVAPGFYYFGIKLDPNNTVTETDETNNAVTFRTVTDIEPAIVTAKLGPGSPVPGCKGPTTGGRDRLQVKSGTSGSLRWTWKSGQATSVADFGDPTVGGGYIVSLYDSDSQGGEPLWSSVLPGGASCAAGGSGACWKRTSRGFSYSDRDGAQTGLVRVDLSAGGEGQASITLKARGQHFSAPRFPLSGHAVVQLITVGGGALNCWQGVYLDPAKNDASGFKSKGVDALDWSAQ